jgi:hypothetical protein
MNRDYSEVYIDIIRTAKSFYNYELKGNVEKAKECAAKQLELAKELVDVVK